MDDPTPTGMPSEADLALGNEPDNDEGAPTGNPPSDEPDPALVPDPQDPPAPSGDEPPAADPPNEDDPPVSKRESKRITQLLDKIKTGQAPGMTPPPQTNRQGAKPLIEDGEYNTEQINAMAEEYAQRRYQEGLATANSQASNQTRVLGFYTDLKLDVPQVAAKHEFLNPESPNYDAGRTMLLNKMYVDTVGYDPGDPVRGIPASVQRPDIGYGEFVDGVMELVDRQAQVQTADAEKNISNQAATQGMRPGGTARKVYQGDDPGQMTDEQLDQAIAQGLSGLPGARRRRQ